MTLARNIARRIRSFRFEDLPREVVDKAKLTLLDYLSCVRESRGLPWSDQAERVSPGVFANAVLGHGLVREDMHTGSVSHLGVVVWPVLIELASTRRVSGRDLLAAAVCGYEVGGSVGRALMSPENVHQYRPTGFSGPFAGAAAGAWALGLDEDTTTSALAFAANVTGGLNEWPYSGGDEMFFHVGFAARNALTSVLLAESGARASETSLEGEAGLFRALDRMDWVERVRPFEAGRFEIMGVFHKPAPACNYAQTGAQCAERLAQEYKVDATEIESVVVRSTAAAIAYPGCNHPGPFTKTLQAKMSIHYCVAAALVRGVIAEANYRRLDDPEINRVAGVTRLELDDQLTAAYPAQQGSEVMVRLRGGRQLSKRLPNVVPADAALIRSRFPTDAAATLIDSLESLDDCLTLKSLLA